jgi:hypothetical protein
MVVDIRSLSVEYVHNGTMFTKFVTSMRLRMSAAVLHLLLTFHGLDRDNLTLSLYVRESSTTNSFFSVYAVFSYGRIFGV